MSSRAIVIPARFGSSRFPGKPLAQVAGRSLLERTWRIAVTVTGLDATYVATDDERIREAAERFGARVLMTDVACATGSDRTYAAVKQLQPVPNIVVNVQGDAVLTPPWVLEQLLASAERRGGIVTPAVLLDEAQLAAFAEAKRASPSSGTTVTFAKNGRALYFSKAIIPFRRDSGAVYRHIGVYGYELSALERFASLPQSSLELCEGLEQLRALENGMHVFVEPVDYRGRTHASIDAPSDVAMVEAIIAKEGELAPW